MGLSEQQDLERRWQYLRLLVDEKADEGRLTRKLLLELELALLNNDTEVMGHTP